MSLVSDLKEITDNVYADDGAGWRTFIIDHIPYLRSKATVVYADETYMGRYRYDIAWFLQDNGIKPEYVWIFRLMNFIQSDFSFEEARSYYMPPVQEITNLYDLYSGVKKVRNG